MDCGPAVVEKAILKAENEWKQHHKRTKELNEAVAIILAQGNPFEECLSGMQKCWEFSKCRGGQTLCHQFLHVIEEMREQGDESVSDKYLTDVIRLKALQVVVKQPNTSLIDLTSKVYAITRSNAEVFEPVVVDLIQNKYLSEAARVVVQLDLRDEFADELAMPFILQEKHPLLESILEGLPHVQERVLKVFDDFYEDNEKVQNLVKRYDIANVKKVDWTLWKKLAKLMTRYLKKYGFPPDICPRLQLSRNRSAMRYLLVRRYRDKDMAEPCWREMVMDQVLDYQVLHHELMRALFHHDDMKCAHYFALKLNFPRRLWPPSFVNYVRDLPPGASLLDEEENNNGLSKYLPLSLNPSQIVMICEKNEFDTATAELAEASIVGVDAEWKPAMGLLQKTRLSLIQMATRGTVYLFDVLKLKETITAEDWAYFFKRVFDNPTSCVLGYGIGEDLRKLEALSETPIFMNFILDLNVVRDALQDYRPELMENVVEPETLKKHNGLSSLTCRLLGYPLDKSEQCSDWENRPLRTSQVHYAALDAHCLLQCWDELDRRCGEENIKDVVADALRYRKPQADSTNGKPSDVGCRTKPKGGGYRKPHFPGQPEQYPLTAALGVGYCKNQSRPDRSSPSPADNRILEYPRNRRRRPPKQKRNESVSMGSCQEEGSNHSSRHYDGSQRNQGSHGSCYTGTNSKHRMSSNQMD